MRISYINGIAYQSGFNNRQSKEKTNTYNSKSKILFSGSLIKFVRPALDEDSKKLLDKVIEKLKLPNIPNNILYDSNKERTIYFLEGVFPDEYLIRTYKFDGKNAGFKEIRISNRDTFTVFKAPTPNDKLTEKKFRTDEAVQKINLKIHEYLNRILNSKVTPE